MNFQWRLLAYAFSASNPTLHVKYACSNSSLFSSRNSSSSPLPASFIICEWDFGKTSFSANNKDRCCSYLRQVVSPGFQRTKYPKFWAQVSMIVVSVGSARAR